MRRFFVSASALFICFSISFTAFAQVTISGTVTSDIGAVPLEGIRMAVSRKSDGAGLANINTDANGYYEFTLTEPRDDLVIWTRAVSPQPYFPEVYQDQTCADATCTDGEVLLGTSIDITTGSKVVDMSLAQSAAISGTISRSDPAGLLGSFEGRARVYRTDDIISLVAIAFTDAAGFYRVGGLSPGTYYLMLSGYNNNLIDELYDNADGIYCPFMTCDTSPGFVFTITGTEEITNIDGTLDSGTQFSGHVSENGTPLNRIFINFYTESGVVVGSGRTGSDGNYVTSFGLPPGNYHASNRWIKGGIQQPGNDTYLPTAYPNTPCGTPCDVTAGNILVADGTPTIVPNIDFAFEEAVTLSGTLTNEYGQPLPNVAIDVLDSAGSLILAAVWTDENGFWSKEVLANATYYVKTIGEWAPDYQAEIWDSEPCNECDALAVGTPIHAADTDVGGIDFQLSLLNPAALSGTVVDADSGASVYPVWVALIDPVSGEDTGIGSMNIADGTYLIENIPPGDYKVHFNAVTGANAYLDELYNEVVCDDGNCGMDSLGAAITLSGGANLLDEDLVLGTSISGNITGIDTAGAGVPGISLWLFDLDCNFINYGDTDSSGDYLIGVPEAGSFYLFAIANDSWDMNLYTPYMNQQYPDINVHSSCYTPWNDVTLGEAIVVADGQVVTDKDFELELGGTISGTISDINGVLANDTAVARLYRASDGASVNNALNKEPDGSYRMGGVLPGTYQVVLTGYAEGLIDERYEDVHCPRNSCDPVLGDVFEVVTGQEVFTGVDAILESGARIRGLLTNVDNGQPIPDYCVYIYNELGVYATVACSDANGNYESRGGLPDGNYRLSNQLANPAYRPVDGGYVPQVWTNDGTFLACGAECDFTLGDTFNVNGTAPVENINLAMSTPENKMSGRVIDSGTLAGIPNMAVHLFTADCTWATMGVTDADGYYATLWGIPAGTYHAVVESQGDPSLGYIREQYPDIQVYGACDNDFAGSLEFVFTEGTKFSDIDFELELGAVISGTVFSSVDGPLANPESEVRLYDAAGTYLRSSPFWITDPGYRLGGILPGEYRVVFSTRSQSLIDELHIDTPCPRGSCGTGTGEPIVLASGDVITGFDATLEPGRTISGTLTDAKTGRLLSGYSIGFFDENGNYAAHGITNSIGEYETTTGLPPGNYYARNVYVNDYQGYIEEVEGEYLPMVWPDEVCVLPCDVLLGDPIIVDGTSAVSGIDMALEKTGITLSGTVTNHNGLGMPNVAVEVLDELGALVDSAVFTDAVGFWNKQVTANATYYAKTIGEYATDYQAEIWEDKPCDNCDAVAVGTPISVGETDIDGIDFQLSPLNPGEFIFGTVTYRHNGQPVYSDLKNFRVALYDSEGNSLFSATTNPAGQYQLSLPGPGSYYLTTGKNAIAHGVNNKCWDDIDCPNNKDPIGQGATLITVGPDSTAVANFEMDFLTSITGRITSSETGAGIYGRARLYASDGTSVASTRSDTDGNYRLKVSTPGDYYVLLTVIDGNLIDELYDGPAGDGIECPRLSCDYSGGHLFTVDEFDEFTGVDGALHAGSRIGGIVLDDGNPVDDFTIWFYNPSDPVGVYASAADSLPDGTYASVTGLPAGSYYVSTQNPNNDGTIYEPLIYNNKACGDPCDRTLGELIVVDGVNDISGINFDMVLKTVTLSGTLSNQHGQPLPNVAIDVLNSDGSLIDAAVWTDDNGFWSKEVLPNATYYAKTIGEWAPDYQAEIWDNEPCNECDALAVGTPIPVADTDVGGIDFQLSLLNPATLSGIVVDAVDGSTPINPVWIALIDPVSGEDTGIGSMNIADGTYLIENIPPGDYKVHFNAVNSANAYVDELYDEIVCDDGGCGMDSTGAVITLAGDTNTLNEDLDLGASILGNITGTDTAGVGVPNIDLWLFDLDCNFISFASTDINGDYVVPVKLPGAFYLFAIANDSWDINLYSPYMNQQYPDINVHSSCYTPWNNVTLGEVINVGDGQVVTGKDFVLEPGGTISGTISDINGVLANDTAVARLYRASDGAPVNNALNKEPDGSYRMGGLLPGTYQVVLSSGGLGLIDERYANEHCPRNSCDPLLGDVFEVVTGQEVFTGVDAILESGAVVRGQLTNGYNGQPIPNYCVYIYNELGVYVTVACGDADGYYESNGGLPDGNYRLSNQLANPAYRPVDGGWSPQVWTSDGSFLACGAECDFTLGDTFTVSGTSPVENINLAMKNAERIVGTVTYRHNGEPVYNDQKNFWVSLYDSTGTQLYATPTNPQGQYDLGLPGPGDYYLRTAKNTATHNIKTNKCWDDVDCPDKDPIGHGADKITVAPYTTFEANFEMDEQARIFGRITSAETGLGVNGRARLYSSDGTSVTSSKSDSDGYYRLGMPPGSYYVLLTDNAGNLIDRLYDGPGGDGIECPRLSCDTSGGFVFTVNEGDEITGINGALSPGSRISGVMLDDGNPVDNFPIWIYNPTDPFGVYASGARTNPDGTYASNSGLPAGSYYVSTQSPTNENNGYYPLIYNNVDCGDPCDRTLGELVVVDGVNDATNIDFTLITQIPATISGHILDSVGNPGPGGAVRIFRADGQHEGDFWVDENGYFETHQLQDGSYFARTGFSWGSIEKVWDGVNGTYCLHQLCDIYGYTPILINGGIRQTGIDFRLDEFAGGSTISGSISDGVNPILAGEVIVFNEDGEHIAWASVDQNGHYETPILADGTFYLRTEREPIGFARELWQDQECGFDCDNPSWVLLNGTPVDIPGVNLDSIDFVLGAATTGHTISGRVTDADIVPETPLANVYMALFDENGNKIFGASTDANGEYNFVGLPNGNYKVWTESAPEGYTGELFNDVPCPDWSCDFNSFGEVIEIIDADDTDNHITLSFTGTRIFGTVTRTDGSPVSSHLGHMRVDAFDVNGDWAGDGHTDRAGNYSIIGLPDGQYRLHTNHNLEVHGLIDETWNDRACDPAYGCDLANGDDVEVFAGQTSVANFELQVGATIRGNVSGGGASLADVEVCVTRRNGYWLTCTRTDGAGDYAIKGLPFEDDLVVFVNHTNGQPFILETYVDQPYGDWGSGTGVNISATNATGVDFELEGGTVVSGTLLSSNDGPVDQGAVSIRLPSGHWLGAAYTDENGNWSTTLPSGEYYFYFEAWGDFDNDYIDEYFDGSIAFPCYNEQCDWPVPVPAVTVASTPIVLNNTLETGYRVTGTIDDQQGPSGQGYVDILDTSGNSLIRAWPDGSGYYESGLLPNGTYRAYAWGENWERVTQLYQGVSCPFAACDLTSGSTFDISSANATNIDFTLMAQIPATISGHIFDRAGNPGPGGAVRIFNANGDHHGDHWVDENGYFESHSLPDGYYFARTGFSWGSIEKVWDGVNGTDCLHQLCDIYNYTPILITGGVNQTDIDFMLDGFTGGSTISGSVSDGVDPVLIGSVVVFNEIGEHIAWASVDQNGHYETPTLADGTFYLRTEREPIGFARELWQDQECGFDCDNPSWVIPNGTSVDIPGVNLDSIDFVLGAAATGHTISGRVVDEDIVPETPLSDVYMALFDEFGNKILNASTDANGEYNFVGLPNGNYRVWTENAPEGYMGEIFHDVPCPDWSCDFGNWGELININDADDTDNDIALSFTGTRIFGTVTRTDGSPVSSHLGHMRVDAFDTNGDWAGDGYTDWAGNYSIIGLPDGQYRLYTDHNVGTHNLRNEHYDDLPCDFDNGCDPNLGDFVTVSTGSTTPANFVLDSLASISGNVSGGGASLADVEVCVTRRDGHWLSCDWTDVNGDYTMKGFLPEDDLVVFVNNTNGQPFMLQTYSGIPGHDWGAATGVDVLSSDANGINFILTAGYFISGNVQDADTLVPIEGVGVCIHHKSDGSFSGACGATDANGNYQTSALPPGSDYVAYVIGEQVGYQRQLWDHMDCAFGYCDFSQGSAINLSSSDVGGVDFDIRPDVSISGMVVDSQSLVGIEGVNLNLWDQECNWLTSVDSDSSGAYSLGGVDDGIYYIHADGGEQGYIRELYPDFKRYHPCDPDIADGQAILVNNEIDVSGVNFDLDAGAVILGEISSSVTGQILERDQGQARLYTPDGSQIMALRNRAPGNGYILGGLLPGTYHVVLSSRNLGLVDELYDGVQCPRFSCGPAPGVPIVVGPEEIVTGIDATLDAGSTISGHLSDTSGNPLAFYSIAFYTEDGAYAGFAFSDELGNYTSQAGFPNGNYLASNQFRIVDVYDPPQGGFLPVVYPNRTCGDPCDFLQGDLINVDGTTGGSKTAIDFIMQTGTSLSGTVTTEGSTPLAGITLQLHSSSDGSVLRSVQTDASGSYEIPGIGFGTYYLRTLNVQGYADQLHAGISCNPFCNPLNGAPLTADGEADIGPISFNLLPTPAITGVVEDASGRPVGGVNVKAYDELGTLVASTIANGDGIYTINNLYAGDFYIKTANSAGFVDGLWSGIACAPGCDPTEGTLVEVPAGVTVPNIDLVLGGASELTGTITDADTGLPISGVIVQVYQDTGAFVSSAVTGPDGVYTVGSLAFGNYHAVSRNTFGYIDEGSDGAVCQSTCSATSTAVITIGVATTVTRPFTLDVGGMISGRVENSGTGELQSITVKAYNSEGALIGASTTDPLGEYSIVGLAAGDVYLRTSNALGYRNQRYSGLSCDALCDVLAGNPVAVSLGATTANTNFTLALGGSIAGTVSNAAATELSGVQVQVFDDVGLLAGSAVTGPLGTYSVTGLNDGDYRLKTTNTAGYIDVVRGGDSCSPEPCATGSGVVTTVASSNETGVDFTLSTGYQISGDVQTFGTEVPLPLGVASAYSSTGQLVKQGGVFSGLFSINGLAEGRYFLLITNSSGLVDQLYSGFECSGGGCTITAGTPLDLGPPLAAIQRSTVQSATGKSSKIMGVGDSASISVKMPKGTSLSGTVKDEGGNAVKDIMVYIFNADDKIAGFGKTNGVGYFITEGSFEDGIYYAATSAPGKGGAGNGLIDEFFGGQTCTGECDPAIQQGTPISIPGTPDDQINFVLGSGNAISGQVTNMSSGVPLASATVELFNVTGDLIGSKQTNGSGQFSFTGLLSSSYFAVASHPSGSYRAILFDARDCTPTCLVTSGTPIMISGTDVDLINFALPQISADNCPGIDNPDQKDSDGDGIGDACEVNPPDIHGSATIEAGALVGDGAQIKKDVVIRTDAFVGPKSQVGDRSVVGVDCVLVESVQIGKDVVLGDHCTIDNKSEVKDKTILGVYVTIGYKSKIGKKCKIGDHATIGNNVTIEDNVTIGPGVHIPDGTKLKKGRKLL